jgi:uncharacterized HAD superfamily protein
MSKLDDGVITPANVTAAYWNNPISRKEAQSVFDQFANAINGLGQTSFTFDITLSFLMERLGIKPEEVQQWAEKKAEELKKQQNIEKSLDKAVEGLKKPEEKLIMEG